MVSVLGAPKLNSDQTSNIRVNPPDVYCAFSLDWDIKTRYYAQRDSTSSPAKSGGGPQTGSVPFIRRNTLFGLEPGVQETQDGTVLPQLERSERIAGNECEGTSAAVPKNVVPSQPECT